MSVISPAAVASVAGVSGLAGLAKHRLKTAVLGNPQKKHYLRVPVGNVAFVTLFGIPRYKVVGGERAPIMKAPGDWFRIPGYRFRCIDTRPQTHAMPQQRVQLKGGVVYLLDPVITYMVRSPSCAVLEVENWHVMLMDLSAAAVEEVVSGHTHDELLEATDLLEKIAAKANEYAQRCGVEIIHMRFSNRGPDHLSQQVTSRQAFVAAGVRGLQGLTDSPDLAKLAGLSPALTMALLNGTPMAVNMGGESDSEAQAREAALVEEALAGKDSHVVALHPHGSA